MASTVLASTASTTADDDFLRVLDEMNRLCGGNADDEAALMSSPSSPRPHTNSEDSSPATFDEQHHNGGPLIGDQLLSSTSSGILSCQRTSSNGKRCSSLSNLASGCKGHSSSISSGSRSRHCSANSGMSCVSFDSAIGDVYSVQTPNRGEQGAFLESSGMLVANHTVDLLDLTGSSCEGAAAVLRASSPINTSSSGATASAGLKFESLAASVCLDDMLPECDDFGGISLRLVGSEDDLVSTSLSLAMNSVDELEPTGRRRKCASPEEVVPAKRRRQWSAASHKTTPINHELLQQRQEVEMICLDLLHRFQQATGLHPRTHAKTWMARSGEDPLVVTTRLLSDSLTRLRIFVFGLDPINWLLWPDRNVLYSTQICSLSIFKASVSVDLNNTPTAFPLPYGEYLDEVEALHLILAHDLYNELRSLISHIQSIGIREFPVMLLVMMVAFFTPHRHLRQPEKVIRVHDYYTHKLQIYLSLRFGPEVMPGLMTSVISTVDKVHKFSQRLREFLSDVTRCGLQKQFESVCENIGLIAFLLQSEPRLDQ